MLAVAGVLLVALGVGLWSVPAGVAAAGVECLAAAYVVTYLKAARARTPR